MDTYLKSKMSGFYVQRGQQKEPHRLVYGLEGIIQELVLFKIHCAQLT